MVCVTLSEQKWLLNFKTRAWENLVNYLSQMGENVLFANLTLLKCHLGTEFWIHCQRNRVLTPWVLLLITSLCLAIESHHGLGSSSPRIYNLPGILVHLTQPLSAGAHVQNKKVAERGFYIFWHKLKLQNHFAGRDWGVRKYCTKKANYLLE